MTPGNVLVNDTVRIKVKFIDTDSATGEEQNVEPVSVFVNITNSSKQTVIQTSATELNASEYYYDFTPSVADEYEVLFTGVLENNTQIIVKQVLYVSTPTEQYRPTITLREDEIITFAADISPLYVDPEEVLLIFPDSSRLEIAEIIHGYSHEINSIFAIKENTPDPISVIEGYGVSSFSVYQYIKASAACELTRIYGYGGDDELSVQLADLKITNRNTPRSNITRSNATTWCQIAAALRKEILNKRVGIRGVQPKGLPRFKGYSPSGSLDPETGALIYINDTNTYGSRDMSRPGLPSVNGDDPMPDRGIKRYD
jgi:hypothetical protein